MSRSSRLVAAAVVAVGLLGASLAVAPAAVADPTVASALPPGGSFVPVSPQRVADTREGGGPVHWVDVDPSGALPDRADVAAVLLNVTVVDAAGAGFVTVGAASGTSNGNYVAGKAAATLALVPYTSRLVRVSLSVPGNVVVDVQGYVTTPAAATSASFTPLDAPRRVADTRFRAGLQPFSAGQTQQLEARRLADLPSDATAVVANVTVAGATGTTYVTGWSGTGARPAVSTVNAAPGDIVANRAVIPLAGNGRLSLYNLTGRTDLVVDVVGYLSPDPAGSYYTPVPATRLLDVARTTSASAQPTITGSPAGNGVLGPSEQDLSPTTAAWLTVVGDQPTGSGFVAARPGGTASTGTSDLNLVPSRAVANAGPVRVADTDGTVAVSSSVPTRLVADLSGWFRQAPATTTTSAFWSASRYPATGTPTRVDTLPSGLPTYFARGVYASDAFGSVNYAYAVTPAGQVEQSSHQQSQPGQAFAWNTPSRVSTLTGVTTLATAPTGRGYTGVYALTGAGALYGFGANNDGELASRPSDFITFPLRPVAIPLSDTATAVFAAEGVGYAVLADGSVVSWGRADTSQLGRTATSTPWVPAPVTFPTGAPVAIAGDGRVSFGIDKTGLTTWWGSALPASGTGSPTVQATPAPFLNGCTLATALHQDEDGVWELCSDGTVVQLTARGQFFSSRQTLPITGVTAIAAGAGTRSGIRALLSDGTVADVPTTGTARSEAGFAKVTAVNGSRAEQVTLVGS